MNTIVIIDNNNYLKMVISPLLSNEDNTLTAFTCVIDALSFLSERVNDLNYESTLIVANLPTPNIDGIALLSETKKLSEDISVIIVSTSETYPEKIIREGAFCYFKKPVTSDVLLHSCYSALESTYLKNEIRLLKLKVEKSKPMFIGKHASILEIKKLIEKLALTSITVMVSGENGTGKEAVARALHDFSNRTKHPFVPVNCGAISESLIESELFGHVKGSFTGATHDKIGLFEEAHGGTIFLDEIGEMSLVCQVKLLRVLQEKTIRPIGSNSEKHINVRVVCATNKDLDKELREGRFREDLYYRTTAARVILPPLRDRGEDILGLAKFLLERATINNKNKIALSLSKNAEAAIMAYAWPGNIREMVGVMEMVAIMSSAQNGLVSKEDLNLRKRHSDRLTCLATIEEVSKNHTLKVLSIVEGNKTRAAEILGIDRKTLNAKIANEPE